MNFVTIKIHDDLTEKQIDKELKDFLERFKSFEYSISGKKETIRGKNE